MTPQEVRKPGENYFFERRPNVVLTYLHQESVVLWE